MTVFTEGQQSGTIAMVDPPPYAIHHLTPRAPTPPGTPIQTKTVLGPPPTPPLTETVPTRQRSSPAASTEIPVAPVDSAKPPVQTLDSRDPLSTCDARFADLILEHVILPRLRVGILRWKDRESFEYVPQTKDDKKARVHRTKYDEQLGFLASEYKFRFHNVEAVLYAELEGAGFKIKRMHIRQDKKRGICIRWGLKQKKNKRRGCCM